VLICPLDWGIGHATRCVPVIRRFMEKGFTVVLAADGRPYEFLGREFPELPIIRFPGTRISYARRTSLAFWLWKIVPKFAMGIWKEHKALKRLLEEEPFDAVVSDNRYGLFSRKCRSILITHQVELEMPAGIRLLSGWVNRSIRYFISRFDECWIPDFDMHFSLAGKLSHPKKQLPNTFYIGPLSRFSEKSRPVNFPELPVYEVFVILSGPEPQRTVFEEIIFAQLKKTSLTGIIVRGKTEEAESFDLTEGIRVFSHLDTDTFAQVLRQSLIIISRPGYSSLMDIVTVGKRAIFVPTPGQTEQEYLARYLMDKKIFFSVDQCHFDLTYAIQMSVNYPGMVLTNDYEVLRERIENI
jgi:uncharacterized protein (TIGR00661 family)